MEVTRKCSFDMSILFLASRVTLIFGNYRHERNFTALNNGVYLYEIMQLHFHLTRDVTSYILITKLH